MFFTVRRTSARHLLAGAVLLAGLAAAPVQAQAQMQLPSAERMAAELNLSTEQQPVFIEIMEAHISRTQALLAKHGVDPSQGRPPLTKMMAMRGEMTANRKALQAQLSSVLTREQLTQLQTMMQQRQRS